MQNTDTVNTNTFESELDDLMAGFKRPDYMPQEQQWRSPNDFFVKFSLYNESNTGITSINTASNSKP